MAYVESIGHVIDDVTLPRKDRDLCMFGRKIGYLEKRDGIQFGQTYNTNIILLLLLLMLS